jgi:outer membrane murein-binding lipoprotein Lpp
VTGEAGTAASVTQSGTAENPMVEFTIPQGMKGDTGEKGEKGDPGKDAPQEVVLYTAQTLDDAQKAQARENIGAADEARQNILVGSETGNPIAVDDAFAAPLRGLTVYGKSTQDGTPSPDNPVPIISAGDDGSITVTLSDGNGKTQTLTLPTPNGLPGIPVPSGGNYTDPQGQQWVCDEVDFARGVRVQRVRIKALSPDIAWSHRKTNSGNNNFQIRIYNTDVAFRGKPCFCNILRYTGPGWDDIPQNLPKIYAYDEEITISFPPNSEYSSLDAFKQLLTNVKSVIYYALATPIETPLTPAELAAYKALTTYAPDTVVQATDGAGLKLDYQRDVNIATNWKPTVNQLNTDVGQLKSNVNQLKTDVDAKINQSDALTLEEIQASTDLTNKVASAKAIKTIKSDISSVKTGGFYSEQQHGNTMPAAYGGFVRIRGWSWPGSYTDDTYYIGIDADGVTYSGIQINGAKQITWKTL